MRAMVLAAGVGSRLDPLTSLLPKPIVPVANIPVMGHILGLLARNGFTDAVANLHYLPEKLEEYFNGNKANSYGVNVELRRELELSGDAGGVRYCRDFLEGDTFVVLMGDLLSDVDLKEIIAAHKAKKAIATIALKKVEDVTQFGVAVLDDQGFIKGFQEKPSPQEAKSDLASTGIYVLEPEVFKHMPETGTYFFGRQLFPHLLELGLPVLGHQVGCYWSDVGTLEQYCNANFDVLTGVLECDMPDYVLTQDAQGRRLYMGEDAKVSPTARIEGNAIIGHNTTVGDGVVLAGNVVIGRNSQIGDNATLINTIVWKNSVVENGATLCGAIQAEDTLTQVPNICDESLLAAYLPSRNLVV